MKPLYLKLGGSVITDKRRPETARPDVIRRLAREIREAREERSDLRLILAHGGGSYPHIPAHEYRVQEGITGARSWEGFCKTQAAAARLNRLVVDLFAEEGLPVVSLAPSSSALCEDGRLVELAVEPVHRLVECGQIPLLYGDVALDRQKGCAIASTEELFCYLARHLPPARLILVGEVAGIYSGDPHADPQARLIEQVNVHSIRRIGNALGGSHGVDVTGGMRSKVNHMVELLEACPDLQIQFISGHDEGALKGALLQQEVRGTILTV